MLQGCSADLRRTRERIERASSRPSLLPVVEVAYDCSRSLLMSQRLEAGGWDAIRAGVLKPLLREAEPGFGRQL
jgi:hypothetical protein